jgi:SAM-dependent methyltransferase
MTKYITWPTLDKINPRYFSLVRERMEKRVVLECFRQTRGILQSYAPLGSCLDIGCASGYLYFHIEDLVDNYHGVDASRKFIEYGREQFKKQHISRAKLHQSWFENFKAPCGFDALICLGLFYIFPNYHWALDAMMKMNPKVIVLRSLFSNATHYRYVPDAPGSSRWTYYNIYSTAEITEFVESRGWKAIWHEDDYVTSIGGYYETGGIPFPFKFLELVPKG